VPRPQARELKMSSSLTRIQSANNDYRFSVKS
jgi:hypothetical protein